MQPLLLIWPQLVHLLMIFLSIQTTQSLFLIKILVKLLFGLKEIWTSTRNISPNLVNSSSLFVTTTGDIYVDSFHTIGGISHITLNLTVSIPTMNICQQCWDLFINTNNVLYCSLSERHQIIGQIIE